MVKPKSITEWGLSPIALAKVKKNLNQWLKLFVKQASGGAGNVFRANFIENDFFYFTSCGDVLRNNPEAKGSEDALSIRERKRKVMLQLFVRTLLGEKLGKILTCSHCGYVGEKIEGSKTGGGHFKFCPNCKKTTISTYPGFYNAMLDEIKEYVKMNEKGQKRCCECKTCET